MNVQNLDPFSALKMCRLKMLMIAFLGFFLPMTYGQGSSLTIELRRPPAAEKQPFIFQSLLRRTEGGLVLSGFGAPASPEEWKDALHEVVFLNKEMQVELRRPFPGIRGGFPSLIQCRGLFPDETLLLQLRSANEDGPGYPALLLRDASLHPLALDLPLGPAAIYSQSLYLGAREENAGGAPLRLYNLEGSATGIGLVEKTAFGTNTRRLAFDSICGSLVVTANGAIWAWFAPRTNSSRFTLFRLLPSGEPDPGFVPERPLTLDDARRELFAPTASGGLVFTGFRDAGEPALTQVNPDGAIAQIAPIASGFQPLSLTLDGAYGLSGFGGRLPWVISRIRLDGTFDHTFASQYPLGRIPHQILVQPANRLIILEAQDTGVWSLSPVALNADGSIDPAYDGGELAPALPPLRVLAAGLIPGETYRVDTTEKLNTSWSTNALPHFTIPVNIRQPVEVGTEGFPDLPAKFWRLVDIGFE